MGYTHYWNIVPKKGQANKAEELYQKAIKDCNKVIRHYQRSIEKGSSDRLSGYSAHTSKYSGININGAGDRAHESFIMREHFNQNGSYCFCKTARKPYDVVVVACLAILKHRLGDLIQVNSDGNCLDWNNGVELARKVTRLKIKNPATKTIGVVA